MLAQSRNIIHCGWTFGGCEPFANADTRERYAILRYEVGSFRQSKTERRGDRTPEILRLAAPGNEGREREVGPLLDNQPRF